MKPFLVILSLFLCILSSSHAQSEQVVKPPEFISDIVSIVISKIEVKKASLSEIIPFVAYRIRELDPRQPDPSGISFITKFENNTISENKISYSAKNIRVDKLLRDLSLKFNIEFHVTSVGVIITSPDGHPFPNTKAKKGVTYYTYKPIKSANKSSSRHLPRLLS